jgi:hypothetical protein
MRPSNNQYDAAARLLWLALAVLLLRPLSLLGAAPEEAFPLLRIGTRTYTNVTVTTKAKSYIFILHAGGMTSIKLADLPPETREKLGYAPAEKTNTTPKTASGWAKAEVAKLETPQVKEIRTKLEQRWRGNKSGDLSLTKLISTRFFFALLGLLVLLYLFHCYCFMLICQKAGHPPGPLVWLPIFQWFPLLRAAGMSPWWFVAMLLPLLNVAAFVLWSVKIAKARGKSPWVALFLILPLTGLLAILYLAFSTGGKADGDGEEPQVMSLQTV